MNDSKVVALRTHDPVLSILQDELWNIICEDRFGGISLAATVGVLEFLKWNAINGAD